MPWLEGDIADLLDTVPGTNSAAVIRQLRAEKLAAKQQVLDHPDAVARVKDLTLEAWQVLSEHREVFAEIVAVLEATQKARGPWHDTAHVVLGRLAELGALKAPD